MTGAKPETAPRPVAKPELQLGRLQHQHAGFIHLDLIPREAKLQQDGPQGSLPDLQETRPTAAFKAEVV